MYRGDPTTGAPFIFLTEPPVTPTSPAGPGYQDLNKADGSGHLKPRPDPHPNPNQPPLQQSARAGQSGCKTQSA